MNDNLKNNSTENGDQSSLRFRFLNLFQHTGDSLLLFPLILILIYISTGEIKLLAKIVFAGMTITGLVVLILKQLFRRERPAGTAGKMYRKFDRFSFPSGHAARAWTIVVIVAFFHWLLAAGLSIWAVLITYSRLKLKLHDVTDVTAGVIIGVTVGFFLLLAGSMLGFL